MKEEAKFSIGQVVDTDTLIKPMKIVDFWWEDDALSRNPKKGAYVYRLAFMTKKGGIDNRQNFRRFDETRLTLI